MKILLRAVSKIFCAQSPSRVEGSTRVVESKNGVAGELVPVLVHREWPGVALHAHLPHVARYDLPGFVKGVPIHFARLQCFI